MQKKSISSICSSICLFFVVFIGFANTCHATALSHELLSHKTHFSKTLEYLKPIRTFFPRSLTHFYNHRYAYGIGIGALIIIGEIVWGFRKIHCLQKELDRRSKVYEDSLLEMTNSYNKLKNSHKITIEIKPKEFLPVPGFQPNQQVQFQPIGELPQSPPDFGAENLLPPPPPPFEDFKNSLKEINDNAKEIEDTQAIKDELQKALNDTQNSSKIDVEKAISAVFQNYHLIKNANPQLLIDMAQNASKNNLSASVVGLEESVLKVDLNIDQIISIAKNLQQNKTTELTAALLGKEAEVKTCIQKIARFIIRFFSSKTLTQDIKKQVLEQKTTSLNKIDFSNVHLKKLPPLPAKNKDLETELLKKIVSRPKISSHELEELDKKTSLEKLNLVKQNVFNKEHNAQTSLLGEIENFSKNKLNKVIQKEVVKKEINPIFEELVNKFKNTNQDDEDEDEDDEENEF